MASPGQAIDLSNRRDKKRRKTAGNPIHQSATPGSSSVGSSDEDPESIIIFTQSGRRLPGDAPISFVPRRLKRQRFELGDRDSSERKGRREQTQYKKRRVQASGSDSDSDAREEAESSRAGWQEESISEGLGGVVSLLEQVCENNRPISLSKRNLMAMVEDLRSAAEEAARDKRELVQKRNESTKHAGTLDALRQAVTCSICVDYYSDPHALSCGHMACKACLLLWFRSPSAFLHPIPGLNGRLVPLDRNVSHRTKICHVCRAPTFERPVRIYELDTILETLGINNPPAVLRRNDNVAPDPWANIFPSPTQSYRLQEPNSASCPNCFEELVGDRCEACDIEFSEAGSEAGNEEEAPEGAEIGQENWGMHEIQRRLLNPTQEEDRAMQEMWRQVMNPTDDQLREMAEFAWQALHPTEEQEEEMVELLAQAYGYELPGAAQRQGRDEGDDEEEEEREEEEEGEEEEEEEEEEVAEHEEDGEDGGEGSDKEEDEQDIVEDGSELDDRSDDADEDTNSDPGGGSSGSGTSQSVSDSETRSSRSSRGSSTSSLHELNRGRQPVERDYAPGCTPDMDEGGYEYNEDTGRWGHRRQRRHRNRERRHRRDSYDTPPGMEGDMDDEDSFYDPDHSDDESQFWSSSDEESVEGGDGRGIVEREGTRRAATVGAVSEMSEESQRQFDLSEIRRRKMIEHRIKGHYLARQPEVGAGIPKAARPPAPPSHKRQRSFDPDSDVD